MTDDELIALARERFNRCKAFPERDPQGFIAMIDLRNLVPQLLDLIEKLRKGEMKLFLISQYVNVDRNAYGSAIVAAGDAKQARRMSPCGNYVWNDAVRCWCYTDSQSPREGAAYDWTSSIDQVQVRYLGEAAAGVKAGVVCASLNSP